jgi:hypothetical protein
MTIKAAIFTLREVLSHPVRPVILDDLCEHPPEHVSYDGTRCLACGQLLRRAGEPV